MSAPRKFDEETRARAVRLYTDRLRDHGESKLAARKRVGGLLDINAATLRNWIEAEERAGPAAEMRRLRQENAELRRANEILKRVRRVYSGLQILRTCRSHTRERFCSCSSDCSARCFWIGAIRLAWSRKALSSSR